jgi:hypothetical protein
LTTTKQHTEKFQNCQKSLTQRAKTIMRETKSSKNHQKIAELEGTKNTSLTKNCNIAKIAVLEGTINTSPK